MGIFTMILQGVRSNVIRWFNVKISASRFRGDDDNLFIYNIIGLENRKKSGIEKSTGRNDRRDTHNTAVLMNIVNK